MTGWATGTRLILRKERPHPGAQLHFTDSDGLWVAAFISDTSNGVVEGQLAGLELRHRQHARVEDRIREAKATGLRNLPFNAVDANAAWLEIVLTATDLVAWAKLIGVTGDPDLANVRSTRSATGSCTSPPVSPAAPDKPDFESTPPGAGQQRSPPPGPGSAPRSTKYRTVARTRRKTPPALESPPPSDTGRTVTPRSNNQRQTSAGTGNSPEVTAGRKIEASSAGHIQASGSKPMQ